MGKVDWKRAFESPGVAERRQTGRELLNTFGNCYDSARKLRDNYFRCKRFVAGDQWSDIVDYHGRKMTEKALLEEQGKYAVVNNFLKNFIRNYVGAYVKQDLEAICSARGGAKQKLADALSTMLQYNWDLNSQKELNAASVENGLIAPCIVQKVSIGIKGGELDVYSDFVDFPRFIVDPNMKDPRGSDVSIVGEIHDMERKAVISAFAKKPGDIKRLKDIYAACNDRAYMLSHYKEFGQIDSNKAQDFLMPAFGLCRVYEIWTKEYRNGYYCIDYLAGDGYSISEDEKRQVDEENASRIEQARAAGVGENDIRIALAIANGEKWAEDKVMPLGCKLIKAVFYSEDYWCYHFIAPNGEVIDEGESPYEHGGHPYVFRFYPMLGGDARSIIEDIIDIQKDLNRSDSMFDWIMRHSAKGALLMPKDQMCEDDGWNLKAYGEAWAQPDKVIPYNPKAGYAKPEQISKNNTDIGLTEHITRKMDWIQRIIGIEGPLQGRSSFAGQSGTMYAQQVEQGTTSLMPLLNTVSAWTKELVTKQVQCIQQCYDAAKIQDICSDHDFDPLTLEEVKDVKTMKFGVRVNESRSSAAYRSNMEQNYLTFLQMGLIDFDIYLQNTTLPYGWKLQRDIEHQRQTAIAEGGQPLPSAVPQQASEAAIAGANNPEAGANNTYNRIMKKD